MFGYWLGLAPFGAVCACGVVELVCVCWVRWLRWNSWLCLVFNVRSLLWARWIVYASDVSGATSIVSFGLFHLTSLLNALIVLGAPPLSGELRPLIVLHPIMDLLAPLWW